MSRSSVQKGKRGSGLPNSSCTAQFEQLLIYQGVYADGHRSTDGTPPPKPQNLEKIRQILSQRRPSLSPSAFSEIEFERFQAVSRRVNSESELMGGVVPIITGARDYLRETQAGIQLSNLEKFAPGLGKPMPDKYYGARPMQIDLKVRDDLDKYIAPAPDPSLPAAPNFFFEGKNTEGGWDETHWQLMLDNACGARAMFELQNYRKETPVYDGNAYTIGSSYCQSTGTLRLYSTHPRQSASGRTEYHITLLNNYHMTDNIDSCRQGIAAYRNSRDFTEEQRNRLIATANCASRE